MRVCTWLALVAGCAAPCPEGYREELDQCVATEETPHPCEDLPETKIDAAGEAVMVRIDVARATCFWIDQTEVSVGAYARWLAQPHESGFEPSFCKWKSERSDPIKDSSVCEPAIGKFDFEPFAAQKPIRCVDFCDAEAYCRDHGKYLCYDSQTSGTSAPRALSREWRIACSNDFTTVFPWGNDMHESRCQMACVDATCGALPVGQRTACRTTAGVADLVGNVAEWTYACTLQNVQSTGARCLTRGGSYEDARPVACDVERPVPNQERRPNLGFRCCSSLSLSEQAAIQPRSD